MKKWLVVIAIFIVLNGGKVLVFKGCDKISFSSKENEQVVIIFNKKMDEAIGIKMKDIILIKFASDGIEI